MKNIKNFEVTSFDVHAGRVYSSDMVETFKVELTHKKIDTTTLRQIAGMVKNFHYEVLGPNKNNVFGFDGEIKDDEIEGDLGAFVLYRYNEIENGETWKEGLYVVRIINNIVIGKLVDFFQGLKQEKGTFTRRRQINPDSHLTIAGIKGKKIYYTKSKKGQKVSKKING